MKLSARLLATVTAVASIACLGTLAPTAPTGAAGAAGAAGRAPAAAAKASVCPRSATHHVTRKQDDTRITLLRGQCVLISLQTATDGNYGWHTVCHASRAVARVVRIEVTPNPAPPGVVGGSSTTTYLFRRAGAGSTTLCLDEQQNGQPQKSDPFFELTIRGR